MENVPIPKLEKTALPEDVAREKVPHLFETFGKESVEENGQIVIENDLIKARLWYEELKFDIGTIPRTEEEFIGTELGVRERALIRFLGFMPDQYFQLKDCKIENKTDGSVIDISKELGENTLYVKKGGNDISESAAHYLNTYIKLNIEPKSAAGILVMMHEVGHKKDPSIDPLEMMLVSLGKEKDQSALQKEMIDRERYAWAYSLSKLRSYLKGLNIPQEDIDVFVHKWTLGSYSAAINPDILEKETKAVFSKILGYFKN